MFAIILILLLATANLAGAQDRDIDFHGFAEAQSEYDNAADESSIVLRRLVLVNTITAGKFQTFAQLEAEPDENEIEFDRAWVEYLHSDKIKVRAGRLLTPFGIYNLIHDAPPAYPTISLPLLYEDHSPLGNIDVEDRIYTKSYTGIQLSGGYRAASGLRFSYNVGLGKGRGEKGVFAADQKATSLRFKVTHPEGLQLGLSYQRDRNQESHSGKAGAREQLIGLDLEIDHGPWLLQTEYARFRLEKATSDFHSGHIAYGLLGYRIGAVTPLLRYDRVDPNHDATDDTYGQWLLGANIAATNHLILKSELQIRSSQTADSDWLFFTSINWAF